MISRKPIAFLAVVGVIAFAALMANDPFDRIRHLAGNDAATPGPASAVRNRAVTLLGQNSNLYGDLIEVDISFKNNTDRAVGGTQASMILHRPDGAFYKSKRHYIILSAEPLGPGEIGTFEFYIDNPERLSDYKYQVVIH